MTAKLKALAFTLFSVALAGGVMLNLATVIDFSPLTPTDHWRIWLPTIGAIFLWILALWAATKDWSKQ